METAGGQRALKRRAAGFQILTNGGVCDWRGPKGGKNAEENRLVGVTCRGGFIAGETVNALLERHSQS